MSFTTFLQHAFRSGLQFLTRLQRWKQWGSLIVAFCFPGLPQLLSKHRVFLGSFLCALSIGVLINLKLFLNFIFPLPVRSFDLLHAILIPNIHAAYPVEIPPAPGTAEELIPIHSPDDLWYVHPLFNALLYTFMALYAICAIISVWDQWRSGQVDS